MPAVKNLLDLPELFKGYEGLVTLFEGLDGKTIARRLPEDIKIPATARRKRMAKLIKLIMKIWGALKATQPEKADEWEEAAHKYKKWYQNEGVPYGERARFRSRGEDLNGADLFLKCNLLAYYSGMTIPRLEPPEFEDKIAQPDKPRLTFDSKKFALTVRCPRPTLPAGIKEAHYQVFAKVSLMTTCNKFLVGSVDAKGSNREITFTKFTAPKLFFGKRVISFKEIYEGKVKVWIYLVVAEDANHGALDSPPSEFAIITLPTNNRGRKFTEKVRAKVNRYRMKIYYQHRKLGRER